MSKLKSKFKFKRLFLYTASILFHLEWCIRQIQYSSIISNNITSTAYNQNTDIYPLSKINIYTHIRMQDVDLWTERMIYFPSIARCVLKWVDVARMRQIWIFSPAQGGIYVLEYCYNCLLIVCCSPLSRTPSHPHPFITHHI